ncbi:MAG: 30S ribosomal protein S12 methylthiotransferase RimO [bacterium]|nr:30S ribosomal protein S12 methylthiotransferase RimO [bacterium]
MKKTSKSKVLGLISLGCPKNTVDSEFLLGKLQVLGWKFTDDIDKASCLVVNTCGFINDARLESEEALEEICSVKAERPDVILVATGCLPQRESTDLKIDFPELDLIVGVGSLNELPDLIDKLWQDRTSKHENPGNLIIPGRASLFSSSAPRIRVTPAWTGYMKISEGCDHSCAFCTIPSIKGPHISRPIDDLVREAEQLASDGVKELILISQDTTAFGSDTGTNLKNLLVELDKIEGISWIRIHYMYPSKISDGLLDVIAESKHIIPYFDIPLQHTQSKILEAMDRLAPETDTLALVKKIRKRFKKSYNPACIRTTFIVGFPGESEDDVEAMREWIEKAKIDRLTVFEFSPEEGTHAADLPDQISESESESRMHRIMEAQYDISLEINETWVGKEIDVLLEGFSDDGRLVGRSYRDAPEIDGLIFVEGVPDEKEFGEIARAIVTGALPYDLEAEFKR